MYIVFAKVIHSRAFDSRPTRLVVDAAMFYVFIRPCGVWPQDGGCTSEDKEAGCGGRCRQARHVCYGRDTRPPLGGGRLLTPLQLCKQISSKYTSQASALTVSVTGDVAEILNSLGWKTIGRSDLDLDTNGCVDHGLLHTRSFSMGHTFFSQCCLLPTINARARVCAGVTWLPSPPRHV